MYDPRYPLFKHVYFHTEYYIFQTQKCEKMLVVNYIVTETFGLMDDTIEIYRDWLS